MNVVMLIVAYAAIIVFLVAVVARFLMWSKMPMHVRWELYPVPHEAKRAHYGGSYLEEADWTEKPREKSKSAELKAMLPEIFFLVALKEHNKNLWYRSFPFHFGLYLIIAATCGMFGLAFLGLISESIINGAFGEFCDWIIKICGYSGLILSLGGAIGLLERRLNDPELKDFTAPADIFNLVFFIVAFGVAFINVLVNGMIESFTVIEGMVHFKAAEVGFLTVLSVLLMGGLVAYIPLTHMSHFVGKYFSYHSIRWDDEPNVNDPEREKEIGKLLSQPVTWAGPHIEAGGKKNWGDLATEEMKKS